MSVVSNASPLISLARIGKLDLLRQLYGELLIPEAVWHEVVIEGVGQPGANEVKVATWIKTQSVTNTPLVSALRQELDAGEAEAIVLTLETQAELLLMPSVSMRLVGQKWGGAGAHN
jgi:predicted nucleic acid-binding protein